MSSERMTVLVVDDEPAVLRAVQRQLLDEPYEVITAEDIRTADQRLAANRVQIVLADHQLGGRETGLDFLARLARSHPDCFRIIFTGQTDFAFAVEAINDGHISAFLPKPWDDHRLHALLRQGATTVRLQQHNEALTDELEIRNRELRRFNQRLELLVDERTSELKQANQQLRTYQNELVRLETQASITQLLRGLAHEFNNPLSVILGYAQRMGRKSDDPMVQKSAEIIMLEGSRCQTLIDQLRRFASGNDEPSSNLQIAELIRPLTARLQSKLTDIPAITVKPSLPAVHCGRQTMIQVLETIITNASESGADQVAISADLRGEYLTLRIDDNGEEPSEEAIRNSIKPFYTTKTGDHLGLGLAIAASLLKDHNATIALDRSPLGGARCNISLPRATQEYSPMSSLPSAGSMNEQRILVIDDEPLISELVADLCEENGLKCTCCTTLAEAREALQQPTTGALIDITLPDGDGLSLATELQSTMPHLKDRIVVMTGDPSDDHARQTTSDHQLPLIGKPFRITEINQLLASWAPSSRVQ